MSEAEAPTVGVDGTAAGDVAASDVPKVSASEARRRKVLARGADRLKSITGEYAHRDRRQDESGEKGKLAGKLADMLAA